MLQIQNAVIEIEKQQKPFAEGTLEYLLAELLKDMCISDSIAEVIFQDLQVKAMNLKALGKYFTEYAKENQQNNSYGMGDKTARHLIEEFYKIAGIAKNTQAAKKVVSIFDLI